MGYCVYPPVLGAEVEPELDPGMLVDGPLDGDDDPGVAEGDDDPGVLVEPVDGLGVVPGAELGLAPGSVVPLPAPLEP